MKNLVDERFGKLVVVRAVGRAVNRGVIWEAKCDCGTIVRASQIYRRKACRKCANKRKPKHGHTLNGQQSRIYRSWAMMLQRCKANGANPHHGDRGIRVCKRWRAFENFLSDMGERPERTTIDRIDGKRNYVPGNCRWATQSEQSRNRTSVLLTVELAKEALRRLRKGEKTRAIAKVLGVSRDSIKSLSCGRSWKELQ